MKTKKDFLRTALLTLGLGIVLAYALCFVCAKLSLFGICPMDRDSLTIGFILILLGTLGSGKHETQTPEQIISTGILLLCSILGMFLIAILFPSSPDSGHLYAGLCMGFLIGLGINIMRPAYAESAGMWRGVLHFVLTQMDFEKAFHREKK